MKARTRAPAHRVAAIAAVGTLAGLGALAAATPASTGGAARTAVLGARTAADALALAPADGDPLGPAVPAPPVPLVTAGQVRGLAGLSNRAPEPPRLPEPCPCLVQRHDPEALISRLLQGLF